MDVRKDPARSEAQVPGHSLFPQGEASTYWETLAEEGKGFSPGQGSTAQGTASNVKAAAGSHGAQAGSAARSRASLHCVSHGGWLLFPAGL